MVFLQESVTVSLSRNLSRRLLESLHQRLVLPLDLFEIAHIESSYLATGHLEHRPQHLVAHVRGVAGRAYQLAILYLDEILHLLIGELLHCFII